MFLDLVKFYQEFWDSKKYPLQCKLIFTHRDISTTGHVWRIKVLYSALWPSFW